jgi:hypothetical protein
MSRRRFSALAVGALTVVALVAVLAPQRGGDDAAGGGAAVLPGLADRANDVDRLQVSRHDGVVATLEKQAGQWSIAELEAYPADWPRLRTLLSNLAQMKVEELKTANPDYHARLGVEDISAQGASGTRLDISAGGAAWALIVGQEAEVQYGQYMRVAQDAQSVLADHILELPDEPAGWAQQQILDVGPDLIAELSIRHPDGEQVRISRVSADAANFTLRTLPQGREPQSDFKVNALANAYSMLRMEDVRRDPGDPAAAPVQVELLLFSGERYAIEVFEWDGERWIRISRQAAPATDPADEGAAEPAPSPAATEFAGWVYRVGETRLETMTARLESVLKPLAAETEASE